MGQKEDDSEKGIERLQVRLPLSLHARLTKRADANHRSLNGEIVTCLEKYLERELMQNDEAFELGNYHRPGAGTSAADLAELLAPRVAALLDKKATPDSDEEYVPPLSTKDEPRGRKQA